MGLFDGDTGISVQFGKPCSVGTYLEPTIAYLTRRECKRVIGVVGVVAAGGNRGGAAVGVKDEGTHLQRGRGQTRYL